MNGAVLAQLMAQGSEGGADMATLRAIAEEAGELAANRALVKLGLHDEAARGDQAELREMLRAWRDAKRSALSAAFGWVMRVVLALVLVGIAVKTGFWAVPK
ncbi:hypothetical protein M9980_13055 [Sphingomonas donggukensis]|uniref:DUF1640 domain-containing protein n=1 Tax=Sphingomonas donggukensis TaxID=2949093 RepID=A0ABY4TU15_9SPHN|nr:DUF6127 family protein [Sphingomonas donggukensis]URW75444.1 hypothetical protein M9980_13055 [Sphingomonas donggukensis]